MYYVCYYQEPKELTCLNPEIGAIAVTYLYGVDWGERCFENCKLLKCRKNLKIDDKDTIYFVNFYPEDMIRRFLSRGIHVFYSTFTVEEYPGIVSNIKEETFTVKALGLNGEEVTEDDRTRDFDQLFFARKAPEMITACRRSKDKHKLTLNHGLNEYFNDGIDAVFAGVDFHGAIRAYADLIEVVRGKGCFVPSLFVGAVGLMHSD
ncbi:hypothetical protein [Moorena sp. SIO3A5]|uniref:hypothetical protein n=1 Tax=Moorena sp. SIO3A5 TaxID=2607822 RepID=UPI00141C58C6|nr:hypothetical protein [Moorena sp. SIO3A5]NEP68997.1 hypothetical protein [Moorena sp. SIO3A5]